MDSQAFRTILTAEWPGLSTEQVAKVVEYRERVLEENQRQNLTKLTSPSDFYYGHVADVKALLECPWIGEPAMDLGSGCGVPGLLAALLSKKSWIVSDSEGHKAAFLARTAQDIGLSDQVRVVSGRAEQFLAKLPKDKSVGSIVARAVGPVERIYGWLRTCSTWNNLILLKGPGWPAEWERYLEACQNRPELRVTERFDYIVGPEKKERVILRLDRVPRGTK